jgi:hypothetical protein
MGEYLPPTLYADDFRHKPFILVEHTQALVLQAGAVGEFVEDRSRQGSENTRPKNPDILGLIFFVLPCRVAKRQNANA